MHEKLYHEKYPEIRILLFQVSAGTAETQEYEIQILYGITSFSILDGKNTGRTFN